MILSPSEAMSNDANGILDKLKELTRCFAIEGCGDALMPIHDHLAPCAARHFMGDRLSRAERDVLDQQIAQ